MVLNVDSIEGKKVTLDDGEVCTLSRNEALQIMAYLMLNSYVFGGKLTEKYREDMKAGSLQPLAFSLIKPKEAAMHRFLQDNL